jgi:ectoine hydroxylase-related dioxygenase (phytanoyl-CoA dioxygenase family)
VPNATRDQQELSDSITTDGWVVVPPVVPQLAIDRLLSTLESLSNSPDRAGLRNLFDTTPAVRDLARSDAVRSVAEAVLGAHCFASRVILFDKTPRANWKVVWHQDLTIAVRERAPVQGFEPWSEKEGVTHVQPPVELLERMLAVRVHLDCCDADNGPVRVITGSHRVGRLSAAAIDDWRAARPAVDCCVERGGILAFRPLILHASSTAVSPSHRRVLHFEFAAEDLPHPLEWHARVA